MRTLIAGFGNELRGDDGFGVEVVQRVHRRLGGRTDVDVLEVGTGGLQLAQQLLNPYDRLVVVDAMTRGGRPGTMYVLELIGDVPGWEDRYLPTGSDSRKK